MPRNRARVRGGTYYEASNRAVTRPHYLWIQSNELGWTSIYGGTCKMNGKSLVNLNSSNIQRIKWTQTLVCKILQAIAFWIIVFASNVNCQYEFGSVSSNIFSEAY